MSSGANERKVVFAGGGHAHLHSLLRTAELAGRGCEVTLINPSPYLYYSGMATGVISNTYTPEQDRIDVRRLVERGGGHFVQNRVSGVMADERELLLADGERVGYDLGSFCLGSEVAMEGFEVSGSPVIPVKPVENTAKIRDLILSHKSMDGPRVLVIGGGAAGCEVAANAANLMRSQNVEGRITVAEAGSSLLGASPKKARRAIFSYLESLGVEVLLQTTIVSVVDGVASTAAGDELDAELIVPATGIVPRTIGRNSSLLTGGDGGLWVNHHLQSVSDRRLFGGGDSISFRGESLPRLGVFGIRQGPVIFHNLISALEKRPLETYTPQKRYLYILNLGDGTGLGIYGSFSWRGRSAMMLKHYIDQQFVRQYSV